MANPKELKAEIAVLRRGTYRFLRPKAYKPRLSPADISSIPAVLSEATLTICRTRDWMLCRIPI